MSGTTINISGSNNDSNLVLTSPNATVTDNGTSSDSTNLAEMQNIINELKSVKNGLPIKCDIEKYSNDLLKISNCVVETNFNSKYPLFKKLVEYTEQIWNGTFDTTNTEQVKELISLVEGSIVGFFGYIGAETGEIIDLDTEIFMYNNEYKGMKPIKEFGYYSYCSITLQNGINCCVASPNCDIKAIIAFGTKVKDGYQPVVMPTAPGASTAVNKTFNEVMTDINVISTTLSAYGIPEASQYAGISLNNLLDSIIIGVYEDPSFGKDKQGNPRNYLPKKQMRPTKMNSFGNKADAKLMENSILRCVDSRYCNNSLGTIDVNADPGNPENAQFVTTAEMTDYIQDGILQAFLSLIADNMFWVIIDGEWKLRSSSSSEYAEQYTTDADGYKVQVINGKNVIGPDMITKEMHQQKTATDSNIQSLRSVNFYTRVMDNCCIVTQEFAAYFLLTARANLECGGNCSSSISSAKALEGPKMMNVGDKALSGDISFMGRTFSNVYILFGFFQSNLGADPYLNWTEELAIEAIDYIKNNLDKDFVKKAVLSQMNGIVAKQQF